MNDPLLNGQLDAVVQVEPFRSALMATDKAEILSWTYVETAPTRTSRNTSRSRPGSRRTARRRKNSRAR